MMHDYIIQTCLRLTLLAPQKAATRANFRSFTIPPPPPRGGGNSLCDKQ